MCLFQPESTDQALDPPKIQISDAVVTLVVDF